MATLLVLSGCSEDEPVAQKAPSALARYTAASGSATMTPGPTATAPAECVKTAGMSEAKLTEYLTELRSSSGAYGSKGLTLDSSGLNFTPEDIQRPCEAVTVKLAHYAVDVQETRAVSRSGPARYEHRYTRSSAASYRAGPKDGRIPDTAPPAVGPCHGTLSVAYLGRDVPLRSLPASLELADTTVPVPVDVDRDGVLIAVYFSATEPKSC